MNKNGHQLNTLQNSIVAVWLSRLKHVIVSSSGQQHSPEVLCGSFIEYVYVGLCVYSHITCLSVPKLKFAIQFSSSQKVKAFTTIIHYFRQKSTQTFQWSVVPKLTGINCIRWLHSTFLSSSFNKASHTLTGILRKGWAVIRSFGHFLRLFKGGMLKENVGINWLTRSLPGIPFYCWLVDYCSLACRNNLNRMWLKNWIMTSG